MTMICSGVTASLNTAGSNGNTTDAVKLTSLDTMDESLQSVNSSCSACLQLYMMVL